MIINALSYLDECGDLGWKLERDYQDHGSSRFFVIGMVVGINNAHRRFTKIIERWHKAQNFTSKHEKKWTSSSNEARKKFLELLNFELENNKDLKAIAIVFEKSKLPKALEESKDKKGFSHFIYACGSSTMIDKTIYDKNIQTFSYCPDELNESYKILDEIIKFKILFTNKRSVKLNRVSANKAMTSGLNCADMVSGAIWEAYENKNSTYIDIIGNNVEIMHLF